MNRSTFLPETWHSMSRRKPRMCCVSFTVTPNRRASSMMARLRRSHNQHVNPTEIGLPETSGIFGVIDMAAMQRNSGQTRRFPKKIFKNLALSGNATNIRLSRLNLTQSRAANLINLKLRPPASRRRSAVPPIGAKIVGRWDSHPASRARSQGGITEFNIPPSSENGRGTQACHR